MNIISYKDIKSKNLDKQKINDILTKKEKLIVEDKKFYFALSLPILTKELMEIKGNNTRYVKGLDYSNILVDTVDNLFIYKLVFYLEKNKYIITDDIQKLDFINKSEKILNLFVRIIDKCEKDYRRINEILYNIKQYVTFLDFFNSYKMIEYIDKLLYYTITYQNLINDMIMIVSRIIIIINYNTENKENDDYDLFKNRIKVFRNNISELNEALEDTRHGTMQRISYLDSGTTRILTIVATIFLPTSFLVSLLSMPFDGVPFKNSKKGYLIIVSIILSIFIMLIWFFYEEFINLFAKK
tara:strand:- start:57 stop:950 length:894 start_codon:yes stop_codon:yes gene_type:complete